MRGFDPKWQDVSHFIIGITKEIWDDRDQSAIECQLGFDQILLHTGQHE